MTDTFKTGFLNIGYQIADFYWILYKMIPFCFINQSKISKIWIFFLILLHLYSFWNGQESHFCTHHGGALFGIFWSHFTKFMYSKYELHAYSSTKLRWPAIWYFAQCGNNTSQLLIIIQELMCANWSSDDSPGTSLFFSFHMIHTHYIEVLYSKCKL